jgi:DNA-directed RNA polymerase specialized sigma24 family protein
MMMSTSATIDKITPEQIVQAREAARTAVVERSEAWRQAAATAKRLRDEQRQAITLAVLYGMSEAEVVRLSGVGKTTVRDWLGK